MKENVNEEDNNVVNPLLGALRIPGETFKLPSHGLFYEDGVLDKSVKNGEVEVYPMTAIDEIIISSPDKLLSGKAINEVFAHCIPQIKQTNKLLAKDVDFLMVCLRMVSFGRFMEVTYNHKCEDSTDQHYQIDIQSIINKSKAIDPTTLNQEYISVLTNGQKVSLNPMTYGDIIELYQDTMLSKSNDQIEDKEAEKIIINTISSVIKSVDGISDRVLIKEWVANLPLGMKKQIQLAVQSVGDWGIDMKDAQICKNCKEEIELRISANPVNFFI